MGDPVLPVADAGEPLSAELRATPLPDHFSDLRGLRLEFTSRGDRVPVRLLLPPRGDGPFPLVLLQHGAGGSKDADYLDAAAGPWVRGGAAVASLDFPLHGERASDKLSERLLLSLAGDLAAVGAGAATVDLWTEFTRQAVIDLQRGLDALVALPEIDGERVTYAAFSLGVILGGVFLGVDPRPRAAALALGGGGFGPPAVDPARHVGRFAPRPLLMVNGRRDERVPRSAAEALFAAAGEPKRIEWFDAGHHDLPGVALKAMWTFLRPHLGL